MLPQVKDKKVCCIIDKFSNGAAGKSRDVPFSEIENVLQDSRYTLSQLEKKIVFCYSEIIQTKK